jgi:hypothetical protein
MPALAAGAGQCREYEYQRAEKEVSNGHEPIFLRCVSETGAR